MTPQTELDGVPVLLAPRGDAPFVGGLIFRVGIVDESPRWRGVSHLIEHLILAPLVGTSSHANGETGPEFTAFHTQGSETEVVEFLAAVCQRLGQLAQGVLDLGGLEREKAVLRTEEAGRSSSLVQALAAYRFGARSYGRTTLPEWGRDELTPADLASWAQHFFTHGNVVCWLYADEPPAGLRLPLPDGVRQPPPAATSGLPQTPAYFPAGSGLIGWSAVLERSTAATVLADMTQLDLMRALRTESGLSYNVGVSYQPRTGGVADLFLSADALEEKQDAALGVFLRGLTRLKLGKLSADDLEIVRTRRISALQRGDAERGLLTGRAVDLLLEYSAPPNAGLIAGLERVTLDEVAEQGRRAFATGLLRVPAGRQAENAGFVRAPDTSPHGVDGVRYPAIGSPSHAITVGPSGVSWGDGEAFVTVEYADCEALVVYPDGGRQMVGADANVVRIEPTLYDRLGEAVAEIDALVPQSQQVRVSRPDDRVPRPRPAQAEAVRLERPLWAKIVFGAVLVIGWLVALLMLLTGVVSLTDPGQDTSGKIIVWVIALVVVAAVVLLTVRWARWIRGR